MPAQESNNDHFRVVVLVGLPIFLVIMVGITLFCACQQYQEYLRSFDSMSTIISLDAKELWQHLSGERKPMSFSEYVGMGATSLLFRVLIILILLGIVSAVVYELLCGSLGGDLAKTALVVGIGYAGAKTTKAIWRRIPPDKKPIATTAAVVATAVATTVAVKKARKLKPKDPLKTSVEGSNRG